MLSSKCCGPAKSVESVPVLSGDAALRRGEFVTGEPTGRRMPGALPPRGDPVREMGAREGDRLPSNKRSSRQKRATVLGEALGVFGTSGTKASASALKGLCESRSGDESDCGMKSLMARRSESVAHARDFLKQMQTIAAQVEGGEGQTLCTERFKALTST